jgi:hypothetical protein
MNAAGKIKKLHLQNTGRDTAKAAGKAAGSDGRVKKRRTAGNGSGKTGKRKTDERRTKKAGSK